MCNTGTAETGGWGAIAPPPVFVAKIYKLIKLKAKVLNILKILTSDLYRRCMRHMVRGSIMSSSHAVWGGDVFSYRM